MRRGRSTPAKALAILLGGLVVPVADAQTVDVHYRTWRWLKEPSAARSAGLAGAATAVTDDAASAEANPAALTSLSKSEVRGTLLNRSAGRTAVGDALTSRTGIGFVGFAGRLSARWAVGAYVVEPQSARLESAATPPAGVTETGALEGTLRETGMSLAWRPLDRLHVGVRVSTNHLALEGSYRVARPEGGPAVIVDTQSDSTRTAASWGVLYEAGPRLRLGLARLGGARWPAPRTTRVETSLGETLSSGSGEVRQPTVTSAGASYQASPRVLVTGQVDYVRYGEIQTPFASRPATESATRYGLYAWEPRIGIEVSLPFRSLSLQLRAGLRGRSDAGALALRESATAADAPPAAPAPLPTPAPAPSPGPPTAEQRSQLAASAANALLADAPRVQNEPKARAALGTTVVLGNGLSFDVAVLFLGEPAVVLGGLALRF